MKGHAVAAAASKQMLLLDAASVYLLLLLLCYIDAFRFIEYSLSCVSYTCACRMLALFSVYREGFILCLKDLSCV